MPVKMDDLTEDDLDPRLPESVKKVGTEGGPPIFGAVVGIASGLVTSNLINAYSESQPEDKQLFVKYGLKGILTLGGLVEIAAATGMERGAGKTAAIVGGASFVATEIVEMSTDFFDVREMVFPKNKKPLPRSPALPVDKMPKSPSGATPATPDATRGNGAPTRAGMMTPDFAALAEVPV